MRARILVTLPLLVALSACGSGDADTTAKDTAATSAPAATTTDAVQPSAPSSAASTTAPEEVEYEVKEAGFGQDGEYAQVVAIVSNPSDKVGQTVTVNFNLLDATGELLASGSQVESFSQKGADQIITTQVDVPDGKKAAKVEATVDVEDDGMGSNVPFPALPASDIKIVEEYGERSVSYTLRNPLDMPVKDPRIAVACRDASGKIVGGGTSYPELIPAKGKIKDEAMGHIAKTATKCEVFTGAPIDWEGDKDDKASASAVAEGSAQAAFKTWVEQFGAKDWEAQYDTLLNAQRELVTKESFLACRNAEDVPEIKWLKPISETDAGEIAIPGTDEKIKATKVVVQLSAEGLKMPLDSHLAQEGGMWKWMLTEDGMTDCKA